MTARIDPAATPTDRASWNELFQNGRAFYTILLNLGIALNAVDTFIISTILPTVVGEIGGAPFYAWAIMLYMLGTIVGAASASPLHRMFGRRSALVYAGLMFMAGSVTCALAPTMPVLLAGRLVEGLGGGLIVAQSMALISEFFEARLRTRALALITSTWGAAALIGPLIGGVFAEIGWWRGAFWFLVPALMGFCYLAWRLVPTTGADGAAGTTSRLPTRRLALLALGILAVGMSGQVPAALSGSALISGALIGLAALLVWLVLRLDASAVTRLFPTRPLSLATRVGAANWVFFMISVTHTAIGIYFPLKLQVVNGVSPLYIGYLTAFLSFGWTAGSLAVANWTGLWERAAMVLGCALMVVGMAGLWAADADASLYFLTGCVAAVGLGIGASNVHFAAHTMAAAKRGEESVTASSITTIRSIGIAFGAALSGLIANAAGLADGVSRDSVLAATDWVFGADILPPALATLFAIQFLRMARRHRHTAAEAGQ